WVEEGGRASQEGVDGFGRERCLPLCPFLRVVALRLAQRGRDEFVEQRLIARRGAIATGGQRARTRHDVLPRSARANLAIRSRRPASRAAWREICCGRRRRGCPRCAVITRRVTGGPATA